MEGDVKRHQQTKVRREDALYRKVQAAFILNGTTLTAYCNQHGCDPSHARKALKGNWGTTKRGVKAQQLRERLIKASGIRVKADASVSN